MLSKKIIISVASFLIAFSCLYAKADEELYQKLQDISVTVKSGFSEGSGVIITRDVRVGPNKTEKINFVWTAGHVIDNLRSVRTTIQEGRQIQIVEFKDAQIVKELVENGRRVGELKMDAKVLKYSSSDEGEDLALLMIRKRDFIQQTIDFYKSDSPVPIGTELYHVGSLLGQQGSNSMTRGIVSQVGRVLNLGSGDGVVFDQTTVTAFPGSSGGGVFLSERSKGEEGQYMGMLVRGAGETFNLIVPVRRMRSWAKKQNVEWALDTEVEVPTLEDILKLQIEGSIADKKKDDKKSLTPDSITFPTLIGGKNAVQTKSPEQQGDNSMSAMSHYLESGLIGHVFKDISFARPTGIYMGLVGNYNSGALESGLFDQELTGGAYARVSGGPGTDYWAPPATSGQTNNFQDLTFPTATSDWGNVSGVFIADAGGTEANILVYGQLTSSKNVTNGDTFSFASGDLDIFFK